MRVVPDPFLYPGEIHLIASKGEAPGSRLLGPFPPSLPHQNSVYTQPPQAALPRPQPLSTLSRISSELGHLYRPQSEKQERKEGRKKRKNRRWQPPIGTRGRYAPRPKHAKDNAHNGRANL